MSPNECRARNVGVDLSSRSVTRQVLSAQVSLTSVFGMGTGGPSPLKTPTEFNDMKYKLFLIVCQEFCTLKTEQRVGKVEAKRKPAL